MKRILSLVATSLLASALFFSCSSGSSSNSNGDFPSGMVDIKVVSDITVMKSTNGNLITFMSDECDTYRWLLGETEIGIMQSCTIDTYLLENGTYTLSLEAQKGGKWYSYFAQITVNK